MAPKDADGAVALSSISQEFAMSSATTSPPAATPWAPVATREVLRQRADMLARMRAFFAERGVLEVDTPVLSSAATPDPQLESLRTRYVGPGVAQGCELYLQTSPEFPMKRLLASGSGAIFQICKVFRDGEAGRLHNPEFTLLEWYRPGFTFAALMDEVSELVLRILPDDAIQAPIERLSYAAAFQRFLGLDPHQASLAEIQRCAGKSGSVVGLATDTRDAWLDLLLSHHIAPQLGQDRLTFLFDYPASQAALARVRADAPPVAERFELFYQGIELANGFHELADADEQRERFERDLELRFRNGQAQVPLDERLLAALAAGLPDCSGVALGVDRLLMLALRLPSLEQVLTFPVDRA